ncbi:MAG: hypothetical protein WCO84_07595, partial [bacterium]
MIKDLENPLARFTRVLEGDLVMEWKHLMEAPRDFIKGISVPMSIVTKPDTSKEDWERDNLGMPGKDASKVAVHPNRPKMREGKTYDIYVNGKNIGDVGAFPEGKFLMGIGSRSELIDRQRFDAWVAKTPTLGWVEAGKEYPTKTATRLAARYLGRVASDMTPDIRGILMVARRGSVPQVPLAKIL